MSWKESEKAKGTLPRRGPASFRVAFAVLSGEQQMKRSEKYVIAAY